MKKSYKWAVFVGVMSAISFTSNANAYVTLGAKYVNPPLNMSYFNDCITYTYGTTQVSFYTAVQSAVSAWNATSNTKVEMVQTTKQSDSVMDFHNYDLGDKNILGQTSFYVNSTKVNPTTTNWYWTNTYINSTGDWANLPLGALYTNLNSLAKNVASHEEGHALGLDHSTNMAVLMYPNDSSYLYYGVTAPGTDEVAGVKAIYGPLN
ncbi:MAG: matrixin family metalloprotease [Tumebacillaceae bacterium]